jgi:hypothetical protein
LHKVKAKSNIILSPYSNFPILLAWIVSLLCRRYQELITKWNIARMINFLFTFV